jgi:hypothetical protein
MEYYNGLKIRRTHDFMVPAQTTNVMNVKFEYFSVSVETISLNISTSIL